MSRFGKKATNTQETEQRSSKPKNITVLDIRITQTKNGPKPKVQFAKGITVSYNGETLDMGEYNSAFLKDRSEMESDLEFLVEKSFMTEDKANEEVDRIEEKGIQYVLKTKLS